MYGTTFPGMNDGADHAEPSGDERPAWKKDWSNQGSGSGEKKPWSGGQGGGAQFKRKPETDMTVYKPYAISGNREIPPEIQAKLVDWVKKLETLGYTCRTGGLEGIEEAAEKAVVSKDKLELILPFKDFGQKESKHTYVLERAKAVAKQFFPSYDTIKKGAQYFLAKNARLILGQTMASPALFFLCWTEDGADSLRTKTNRTGFTGHPIAIASSIGIPIFNLGNPNAEQRLSHYLESLTHE